MMATAVHGASAGPRPGLSLNSGRHLEVHAFLGSGMFWSFFCTREMSCLSIVVSTGPWEARYDTRQSMPLPQCSFPVAIEHATLIPPLRGKLTSGEQRCDTRVNPSSTIRPYSPYSHFRDSPRMP